MSQSPAESLEWLSLTGLMKFQLCKALSMASCRAGSHSLASGPSPILAILPTGPPPSSGPRPSASLWLLGLQPPLLGKLFAASVSLTLSFLPTLHFLCFPGCPSRAPHPYATSRPGLCCEPSVCVVNSPCLSYNSAENPLPHHLLCKAPRGHYIWGWGDFHACPESSSVTPV